MCCLLSPAIKMWPWYLGLCYHTPLRCPHHSLLCNYTGIRLQLSAKYISSRGAKILFMWERDDILPNSGHKKSGGFWYWANPDTPDTITSKPEARKHLAHSQKYIISNTIQIEPNWEHYCQDDLMVNLWLLGGCCSLYSHDYSDQVCFFEL